MAFTEDLSAFFDTDDFAVEAVFTRGVDTIATVNVIFDVPTEYVAYDQVNVAADNPYCQAISSEVAAIRRGDTCTIDSVAYGVRLIKADGTGVTHIDLELI